MLAATQRDESSKCLNGMYYSCPMRPLAAYSTIVSATIAEEGT
jgi:hypothetical protein